MNGILKDKKAGFYVSFVACILTLVALILYQSAANKIGTVTTLLVIALIIEAVCLIASARQFHPVMNLSMPICTVLLASALTLSVTTQVDAIGYAIAGLYTMDQIMPYLRFAAVAAAAFVVYLVSSYMDYGRA